MKNFYNRVTAGLINLCSLLLAVLIAVSAVAGLIALALATVAVGLLIVAVGLLIRVWPLTLLAGLIWLL